MDFRKAAFCWERRILVEHTFKGQLLPYRKRGQYFWYLCTDRNLGLPENELWSKLCDVPVFGDVFVFRLEDIESSESGGAKYAKMAPAYYGYIIFPPLALKEKVKKRLSDGAGANLVDLGNEGYLVENH